MFLLNRIYKYKSTDCSHIPYLTLSSPLVNLRESCSFKNFV